MTSQSCGERAQIAPTSFNRCYPSVSTPPPPPPPPPPPLLPSATSNCQHAPNFISCISASGVLCAPVDWRFSQHFLFDHCPKYPYLPSANGQRSNASGTRPRVQAKFLGILITIVRSFSLPPTFLFCGLRFFSFRLGYSRMSLKRGRLYQGPSKSMCRAFHACGFGPRNLRDRQHPDFIMQTVGRRKRRQYLIHFQVTHVYFVFFHPAH